MSSKSDNAEPLRVGEILLYYVTLKISRGLSREEKANKFQKREWEMREPFQPGFEPANWVENIIYLEYVEAKEVSISNFGRKETVLAERRCRIFDLMEGEKEGFILVHPNKVSKNEEHLERYLTRLGYKNGQYGYQQMSYSTSQLLDVFYSPDVERKGIRFKTEFRHIEFWTIADLKNDVYYNACKKAEAHEDTLKSRKNIEMEDIDKLNIRVRLEDEKKVSSEIIVYKDHMVCPMSSSNIETWNYLRKLIEMLEETRKNHFSPEEIDFGAEVMKNDEK